MMDPSQTFPHDSVTASNHLTEMNTKILIYLARILNIPEDSMNEFHTKWTFTAEELEALEPVPENYKLSTRNIIDGICVKSEPQLANIENIIDIKRVGLDRRIFYLAKDVNGGYYLIHPTRANRDVRLNKLIEDYHNRTQMEIIIRKRCGIKRLRMEGELKFNRMNGLLFLDMQRNLHACLCYSLFFQEYSVKRKGGFSEVSGIISSFLSKCVCV